MTQNAKPSPESKSSAPDAPISTDGQAPVTSDSGMIFDLPPFTAEEEKAFIEFYKEFMDLFGTEGEHD